jgi:type IV secretory pathway VirB10-like protein
MLRLISLLLLCTLCSGASAQKLYKCRVAGNLIYSGEPCKGVPSTPVEVPDAPRPDPGMAQELKRQEVALERLEKERKVREAQEKRFAASDARLAAGRQDRCEKLRLQKKMADDEAAVAVGAENQILQEKAMRVAEYVASECPD